MSCCGKKSQIPLQTVTVPPASSSQKGVSDLHLATSSKIDEALTANKIADNEKIKLLLLGTGESGKSTIFKQFRILYGTRKSDDDLRMYGVVVRSNTITAITKLCELTRDLGFEERLVEESNIQRDGVPQDDCGMTVKDAYDQIMSHLVYNNATSPAPVISSEHMEGDWVQSSPRAGARANSDSTRCLQFAAAIEVIWQSKTIQDAWKLRAVRNINDSHASFLKDVKRIASQRFIPTEDDVLKARVRTTQVVLERYNIDGVDFEVCDVGGQRAERRKWLGCFTEVTAVIFVAALSEYDQKLAEDKKQNRMVETLKLFGSIVKNAYFEKTPIMLFLNKKDIFEEKLAFSDIGKVSHFSDYSGPPNDFDYGVLYFIQKFEEQFEEEFNDNFIHVTNATDTTNMEFVLNASRIIMMQKNFDLMFK